MSFREKTSWVTLTALVLMSLVYYHHVHSLFEPHGHAWVMHALGVSIGTFLLIEAIAWVVLYLRNPKEARTPRDERERLIGLKASRIAYWVYGAGSLLAIFITLHLARAGAGPVPMAVVIAFVLAQMARHVAIIVYYRRGS
jgi:hypothetical protein